MLTKVKFRTSQGLPVSKANADGSNQITREGGDFWGKEEDRDL